MSLEAILNTLEFSVESLDTDAEFTFLPTTVNNNEKKIIAKDFEAFLSSTNDDEKSSRENQFAINLLQVAESKFPSILSAKALKVFFTLYFPVSIRELNQKDIDDGITESNGRKLETPQALVFFDRQLICAKLLEIVKKAPSIEEDSNHEQKDDRRCFLRNNKLTADNRPNNLALPIFLSVDEQCRDFAARILARMTTLDFSKVQKGGASATDPRALQWTSLFAEIFMSLHESSTAIVNGWVQVNNNNTSLNSQQQQQQQQQQNRYLSITVMRQLLFLCWRCPGLLRSRIFMTDLSDRFIETIQTCLKIPLLRHSAMRALSSAMIGLPLMSDENIAAAVPYVDQNPDAKTAVIEGTLLKKYRDALCSPIIEALADSLDNTKSSTQVQAICEVLGIIADETAIIDSLVYCEPYGNMMTILRRVIQAKETLFFPARVAAAGALQHLIEHSPRYPRHNYFALEEKHHQKQEEISSSDKKKSKKKKNGAADADADQTLSAAAIENNKAVQEFLWMAEVLEEVDEHQPTLVYIHNIQENCPSGFISVLIDKLVAANSENQQLLQIIPQFVMTNLRSENWKKRIAALQMATYVVEHFEQLFTQSLPIILDGIVLPMLRSDPHWRVRMSVCDLLCQFCFDLPPHVFVKPYGEKAIPLLLDLIDLSQQQQTKSTTSVNEHDDKDTTTATDDKVKLKISHDACAVKMIIKTVDTLLDNLDEDLEDPDSDEEDDDDGHDENENGDANEIDEEDDDEFVDDDEENEEEEEDDDDDVDDDDFPARKRNRRADFKLRKSYIKFHLPMLRAIQSQIQQNFQGIANVSSEKEDMMTMERTQSTTTASLVPTTTAPHQASRDPNPHNFFLAPQSLLHVEDQMLVLLMNPISSLLNISSFFLKSDEAVDIATQKEIVDAVCAIALPQLRRIDEHPLGTEFPFQALEVLSVLAHFTTKELFAPHLQEVLGFVKRFVRLPSQKSSEAENNNNNNNNTIDDNNVSPASSSSRCLILDEPKAYNLTPYLLRAINCLGKHMTVDINPHLVDIVPFLIQVGSNMPLYRVKLHEPGAPLPENDDRVEYHLEIGENECEYLTANNVAQWNNVKFTAISLFSFLRNKKILPCLAPFARQIVTLLSKLLQEAHERDDIVSDTADAVKEMADILPHLSNVQARQYLAFSIMKSLSIACENSNDLDVVQRALEAMKEVTPYLRDWDDAVWNTQNLGFLLNGLHSAIEGVLYNYKHRLKWLAKMGIFDIPHQPLSSDDDSSSSSGDGDDAEESSDNDDDDDDEPDDDNDMKQIICAFEAGEVFIALMKKYPKLFPLYYNNTYQLGGKIFAFDNYPHCKIDEIKESKKKTCTKFVGQETSSSTKTPTTKSKSVASGKQTKQSTGNKDKKSPYKKGSGHHGHDDENNEDHEGNAIDENPESYLHGDEILERTLYLGAVFAVSIYEVGLVSPQVDLEILIKKELANNAKLFTALFIHDHRHDYLQTASYCLRMLCEMLQRNQQFIAHNPILAETKQQYFPIWVSALRNYFDVFLYKHEDPVSAFSTKKQQQQKRNTSSPSSSALVNKKPSPRLSDTDWLQTTANVIMFSLRLIPLLDSDTQKQKLFHSLVPHLPLREDDSECLTGHALLVDWLSEKDNVCCGIGNGDAREEDRQGVINALQKVKFSSKTGLSKWMTSETKNKLNILMSTK